MGGTGVSASPAVYWQEAAADAAEDPRIPWCLVERPRWDRVLSPTSTISWEATRLADCGPSSPPGRGLFRPSAAGRLYSGEESIQILLDGGLLQEVRGIDGELIGYSPRGDLASFIRGHPQWQPELSSPLPTHGGRATHIAGVAFQEGPGGTIESITIALREVPAGVGSGAGAVQRRSSVHGAVRGSRGRLWGSRSLRPVRGHTDPSPRSLHRSSSRALRPAPSSRPAPARDRHRRLARLSRPEGDRHQGSPSAGATGFGSQRKGDRVPVEGSACDLLYRRGAPIGVDLLPRAPRARHRVSGSIAAGPDGLRRRSTPRPF